MYSLVVSKGNLIEEINVKGGIYNMDSRKSPWIHKKMECSQVLETD